MSLEPTVLNEGGLGKGGADDDPPETAGGVLPPSVGSLVDVIALTCAIPETIAAPAAAAPRTGPIIGIPASEL